MSNDGFNLADLTPAQMATLFAQFKEMERAQAAQAKAQSEEQKTFLAKFARIITQKFAASERTFASGAVGYRMAFNAIPVVVGEENGQPVTRDANISVLVRWTDTVPAKGAKATAGAPAAADDEIDEN